MRFHSWLQHSIRIPLTNNTSSLAGGGLDLSPSCRGSKHAQDGVTCKVPLLTVPNRLRILKLSIAAQTSHDKRQITVVMIRQGQVHPISWRVRTMCRTHGLFAWRSLVSNELGPFCRLPDVATCGRLNKRTSSRFLNVTCARGAKGTRTKLVHLIKVVRSGERHTPALSSCPLRWPDHLPGISDVHSMKAILVCHPQHAVRRAEQYAFQTRRSPA